MPPAAVDRRWPWAVAVGALLVTAAGVPTAVERAARDGFDDVYVVNALVGTLVPAVGALVLARSRHRIGALLLATAGLAVSFALDSLGRGGHAAWQDWSMWVAHVAWVPFLGLLTLLPLWFPTGAVPARGWLAVERIVLVLLGAVVLTHALAPRLADGRPTPLPVALPDGFPDVGRALVTATVAAGLACVAAAVWRYRRAGDDDRRRLRGFVIAVAVAAAVILMPGLPVAASDVLIATALGLVALTAAAAITDRGTLGVGVWIDRPLAAGVAGVALLVVYVAAVAATASVAPEAVSFLAAAAVAAAFAPARSAASRAVDRVLYGRRSDPWSALAALGERASAGRGRVDLDAAAAVLVACLRSPGAAVTTADGRRGEAGDVDDGVLDAWPLVEQGVGLGVVEVARRPGEPRRHPADERLLVALGRGLAGALRVDALAEDLHRSRAAIVAAREEERRRLHHELHDGLGPTLSHAVLAVDGARHRAAGLPCAELGGDLDTVKAGLQHAVDDLRAAVQGLRPPALDELGLVGVLRHHAALLAPGGLEIDVDAAEDALDGLPAAVEVAAHRIATEALANVARHARARHATVRVAVEGGPDDAALVVAVRDDGVGTTGPPGIGRASIRARAEELGGSLVLDTDAGGTLVRARLPIGAARA